MTYLSSCLPFFRQPLTTVHIGRRREVDARRLPASCEGISSEQKRNTTRVVTNLLISNSAARVVPRKTRWGIVHPFRNSVYWRKVGIEVGKKVVECVAYHLRVFSNFEDVRPVFLVAVGGSFDAPHHFVPILPSLHSTTKTGSILTRTASDYINSFLSSSPFTYQKAITSK